MDPSTVREKLGRTTCNLRLIPGVNGGLERAQLVGFELQVSLQSLNLVSFLQDVTVHEAWTGPARLHLIPHATTPAADLPVRRCLPGIHVRTDLTLPHGRVLFDYKNPDASFGEPDPELLTPKAILDAASMPIMAPSYPRNFNSMRNREYAFFKFKSDPEILRGCLPDVCELAEGNEVYVCWISTEGHGLGSYNKCDLRIPCYFQGQRYQFSVLSIIDSGVVLNAGRELLGQPCKYGFPQIKVDKDTLCATLKFGEQNIATGTSTYKHTRADVDEARELLSIPELNLKLIPGVDGKADIAELIAIYAGEIDFDLATLHKSKGRLALVPHVNAPFADFPVLSDCEVLHTKVHSMRVKRLEKVYDYLT